MANSYKDIIITPNRANTADPKIEFRGANSSVNTAIIVQTYPTSNGTVSFEGSAGQLFSITNDLTGSIFSVNDVSGIPSIEVFANGQINMAQYGGGVSIWGNTGIGTSSPYGIFQIENPTANNAAYKSILTITAHENTEGSTDGYNGTSASFGTTFRRNWNGGSYTDLAGIYAYAQNSWRGGLVFRTKSETSSGGSPADRMVITPAGNVGIGTTTPSGKFQIVGSGSSGLFFDYNNAGDHYYDATATHHFRTNGYVTRMTINSSGSVASTGDMRAPIFYDTDNTSYYVDPASGSNLYGPVAITGGTTMGGGWISSLLLNALFPVIVFGSGSTKWSGIGVDYSTADSGFRFWVNGSSADISGTGTTALTINTANYVTAAGSFRAPLFYDSDNTAYYANPAGASVFNDIRALIYYDQSNTGYYMQPSSVSLFNDLRASIFYDRDNTNYYIDMNGVSRVWLMSLYVGNENVGGANASNEGLVLRGNYNSNTWAHKFHKYNNGSGVPMYLSQSLGTDAWNPLQGWGTGLSYTSQVFGSLASDQLYSQIFYDSDNTAYYANPAGASVFNDIRALIYYDQNNTGYYMQPSSVSLFNDLRASIFYDRDNTTYYVDPSSGSNVLGMFTINQNTSSGLRIISTTSLQSLWVRAGWDTDGSGTPAVSATNIQFQSSGNSDGTFTFVTGNTRALTVIGDYAQGAGSLRAPIFYDSNNTGFYTDPASTSNFNIALAYQYQGNGNVGGTGSASWHPSGIYSAGYNWLYGGISAGNNDIVSVNNISAAIFYDVSNSAYYIDPAAGGAAIVVNGYMLGGLGAGSTSGTLDWNDSTNSRSGSTPTLLLGTATNGPGGSIYYHPLNFEYSSKNGSGNMTQLAIAYGSPGNKLWMRGKYDGTWSSWIEFLHSGGDTQTKSGSLISNTDLRAPLFYDSNNTAFYLDPASTSLTNDFRATIFYDRANTSFYAQPSSVSVFNDFRMSIIYDRDNTSYYVNPASDTYLNNLILQGGVCGLSNSASFTEAALEVRERNFGGAQDDTWATAPRIGFHWGGRVAAQIALSSSGTITILNDPGNATSGFECGNSRANSLGIGTAASGTAGEIRATNNITAYYSDRRLKENITPIENPIAKLMAISGVTFNSNDTAAEYGYSDKKRQVGVIAQEVAAVLPEIVVSAPFDIGQNKDGTEYSISGENYQTVQYEKLVPLLIEAVKAQQTLINSLQEQINALTEDR